MVTTISNSLSLEVSAEKLASLRPAAVQACSPALRFQPAEVSGEVAEDDGFLQFAMQKKNSYTISFFDISPYGQDAASKVVTERAYVMPTFELGWAFFEATRTATQYNKESLTTLFELAEEAACCIAVACVNRQNPDCQSIIKSYLSLGFSFVSRADITMDGYTMLALEF